MRGNLLVGFVPREADSNGMPLSPSPFAIQPVKELDWREEEQRIFQPHSPAEPAASDGPILPGCVPQFWLGASVTHFVASISLPSKKLAEGGQASQCFVGMGDAIIVDLQLKADTVVRD